MTRASCSRTSKRKQPKIAQIVVPEECKENSPFVSSKARSKIKQELIRSSITSSKENCAESKLKDLLYSNNDQGSFVSIRKSERKRTSPLTHKDYIFYQPKDNEKTDILGKRNVLSDKTNSPLKTGSKIIQQSDPKNTQNKHSISVKDNTESKTNQIYAGKENKEIHVPVYRTLDAHNTLATCNLPSLEQKEAVYEFDEVDENEPVQKKKRKKRTNIRRPRIGPKALTINNIKYSSTESLVSLPENPVRQKKTKTKRVTANIKPSASLNNLNYSEDTCCSVKSFMSHPPSLKLCEKKENKPKYNLSVLQETQSEEFQSPINETRNILNHVENQCDIMVNHLNFHSKKIAPVFPSDSQTSKNSSIISLKRSYPSKKRLSIFNVDAHGSPCHSPANEPLPDQGCHYYSNITTLSHDFLSSTPCKRDSLVVQSNSVFEDSYDSNIPAGLRPSTGFIKSASVNLVADDKCFGFDEPEELEEPLLSPIKSINIQEPRRNVLRHNDLSLFSEIEKPKPDVKEIIEMLKSSIPKAQNKENSQVFSSQSSPDLSNQGETPRQEEDSVLSFVKPPRRSYQRQRRIRYHSEHEEEDEEEDGEAQEETQSKPEKQQIENTQKPKKCYQKSNVSKVNKVPKVSKAKQRIVKEEEEMERLAALMNAQFQQIDKVKLVVE